MIAVLLGTMAVAAVFVGIGRVAERIQHTSGQDLAAPIGWLIAGWALASLVAALCALLGVQLLWPILCSGAIGIVGYFMPLPRRPLLWLAISWVIIAPLIVIASRIPPTMFDEFSRWLPNTRFLVEHGGFANAANPNIWSFKPSYPPAIPILGYGVHVLIGHGSELAAKIFSVLLAASFGLVLAKYIRPHFELMAALAIGVAFATVLNPFFDPRIALTAYADAPPVYFPFFIQSTADGLASL